jgi:plastocyanin
MNSSIRTALFGLMISAAACGGSSAYNATAPTNNNNPTGPVTPVATNSVTATTALSFSPQSIVVPVGTTVSWTFQAVGHNVTFNSVAGAPPSILGSNANTTLSATFTTAGTFPYQCTIHPGMTGTVTVQ